MQWRFRLGVAALTVGWFLMGDAPTFSIAVMGAMAALLVMYTGSVLARLERRAIALQRLARRWR